MVLLFATSKKYLGGGVSESMEGRGCAILALELVLKKFNFRIKILPKNLFHKILHMPFQQGGPERTASFVSYKWFLCIFLIFGQKG